jgi:hypothetical protein
VAADASDSLTSGGETSEDNRGEGYIRARRPPRGFSIGLATALEVMSGKGRFQASTLAPATLTPRSGPRHSGPLRARDPISTRLPAPRFALEGGEA